MLLNSLVGSASPASTSPQTPSRPPLVKRTLLSGKRPLISPASTPSCTPTTPSTPPAHPGSLDALGLGMGPLPGSQTLPHVGQSQRPRLCPPPSFPRNPAQVSPRRTKLAPKAKGTPTKAQARRTWVAPNCEDQYYVASLLESCGAVELPWGSSPSRHYHGCQGLGVSIVNQSENSEDTILKIRRQHVKVGRFLKELWREGTMEISYRKCRLDGRGSDPSRPDVVTIFAVGRTDEENQRAKGRNGRGCRVCCRVAERMRDRKSKSPGGKRGRVSDDDDEDDGGEDEGSEEMEGCEEAPTNPLDPTPTPQGLPSPNPPRRIQEQSGSDPQPAILKELMNLSSPLDSTATDSS